MISYGSGKYFMCNVMVGYLSVVLFSFLSCFPDEEFGNILALFQWRMKKLFWKQTNFFLSQISCFLDF